MHPDQQGLQEQLDAKRIDELRQSLGRNLFILAHHYQRDEVVRHADQTGDSLELSRMVEQSAAKHIVFCGVYFMAESAAILAREGQTAYCPDLEANCSMSEMAPAGLAQTIFDKLKATGRKIIPLTYVNSQARVKALCGAAGGATCTSSNAETMLRWALQQGDAVLFLPDRHLAENTANALKLPEDDRLLLSVTRRGEFLDMARAKSARLLIWPGCCSVHHKNSPALIEAIRASQPQAKVIVHPESPAPVVQASDDAGSTAKIINYCEEAPSGSIIYVGTEINLVERLARLHPDKTILPLTRSSCANMAKITEAKLATTLEAIRQGQAQEFEVEVDGQVAFHARLALKRMLAASA